MHYDSSAFHAYIDDAIDEQEHQQLEAHLHDCESCKKILVQAKAEKQFVEEQIAFLPEASSLLPDTAAQLQQLHSRVKERNKPWGVALRWWFVTPIAAAVCVMLFWLPSSQMLKTAPLLPKGATSDGVNPLRIVYARPNPKGRSPIRFVRSLETLHPGDLIAFRFSIKQSFHGMVIGIHQSGKVFSYMPIGGNKSVKLSVGQHTYPKEHALELDEQLGKEAFVLLASKHSFSFKTAQKLLLHAWQQNKRNLQKPLKLPNMWYYRSIIINKQK